MSTVTTHDTSAQPGSAQPAYRPSCRRSWCSSPAASRSARCRCRPRGQARCWPGCGPYRSAARTPISSAAITPASGRRRFRSSPVTSGRATSSRWGQAPTGTAGRSATASPEPRTTRAACARSALRAGTTCARTTASLACTNSTATMFRARTRRMSCMGSRQYSGCLTASATRTGAVIDPASIALHVANRGGVRPGDCVAITGAGAIGLLAGDAALVRGAARVIIARNKPHPAGQGGGHGVRDSRSPSYRRGR